MTAALGVILRGSYDADALRFFAAAGITNGVQKNAVNAMVRALKNASLWTTFFALYPFVGGSATAHAQNLASALYPITWTNAPTQDANGVTGNGTTQYGTCIGLTGTIIGALHGLTVYVRTPSSGGGGNQPYCGCSDATAVYYDVNYVSSVQNSWRSGNVATGVILETAAARTGCISSSRVSTTDFRAFDDGAQVGSTNTTSDTGTPPTVDLGVLMRNDNGTPTTLSNGNIALLAAHAGLTAAQIATFHSIIEAYQDMLGRGVV